MDINLIDLEVGDNAVIQGYENCEKSYREKLLSMGLTKGTEIKLVKIAPLGDPVEVMVKGFNLSMRKEEAKILKLRRV